MDRAAARAKLKELGDAKKKVEEECDMLVELLSQPGFPGLKGGLVDAEGFPRADIDIPDVRTKRHRLACLRTDHSSLMKEIEATMPTAFGKPAGGAGGSTAVEQPQASQSYRQGANGPGLPAYSPPWATVDEVAAGSPAETAGLALGDKLIKFGALDSVAIGREGLTALGPIVGAAASAAAAVELVVLREGGREYATLQLEPKAWSGRGMLGCHIAPL